MFMGEYNHTIDAKGRLIIPFQVQGTLRGRVRTDKRARWLPFYLSDG